MADVKISQLTNAATPLAGTETLPIVQSGSTVKVSVDNLTKGRTVNATTFDTDIAAAGVTLSGTTLAADGTDSNINISITPKGTGVVNTTTLVASGTASATKFIPTGNVVDGTGVYSPASGVLGFSTGGGERGRFTGQGFFKAADSASYIDSTGIFHEFSNSDSNGNYVAQFRNNGVANAFGVRIGYTTSPNSTGSAFLACDDSSANRATIRSNGGLANFQSNNVDLSDARTKKEVTLAASMWGKIGALEIVTYKYNDQTHDDVNLGVIAQQVEAVEPVWVGTEGWGDELPEDGIPLKTVYTKDITFAAIKALQEAMARIEKLEAEVSALKGV